MSVPEFGEDNPLGKLYRKRVAENRDLTVLVASWDLERGTGKTTLGLRGAAAADRTDEGVTPNKATLSAQELTEAYTREPPGSALILDEAEAAVSNRRSMSGVNEALRQIIGMGRVEQKYLFLVSPGVHQIDRDVRNMCDVWIFVREVGEAQMFRVKYNPIGGHELTYDWGAMTWPGELPGGLQRTYDELTEEKRRRLRGNGSDGAGYVKADEVKQTVQQARKQTQQDTRDSMIEQIYDNSDEMTQQDLAEAVGLSRSRVADILAES